MQNKQLLILAIGGLVLFMVLKNQQTTRPDNGQNGNNVAVVDFDDTYKLVPKFEKALTGDHAQDDARELSEIFLSAAKSLEVDFDSSTPAITSRQHIERFINVLGVQATERLRVKRPRLPDVVGDHFQENFPLEQAELTKKDQQLVIELFQALGNAAKEVARNE